MSVKRFTVNNGFDIKENNKPSKNVKKTQSNFLIAKYIGIGYYIGTPLLLGVFLGLVADGFFKTKSLFIIIFIIIGTIGTFYNLFKITKDKF